MLGVEEKKVLEIFIEEQWNEFGLSHLPIEEFIAEEADLFEQLLSSLEQDMKENGNTILFFSVL